MKILVVHRQKKAVGVIKSVLSELNPVVLQTESGLDGLLTSRIEHFDMIICGTDLPVVTGFELTRSLRINSLNRDTPVIIISEKIDDSVDQLGKALNVAAIVSFEHLSSHLEIVLNEQLRISSSRNHTGLFARNQHN